MSPYTFNFSQIGTYAEQPSWVKRYRFAVDTSYEDYWDPRQTNTNQNNNPAPISSQVFTARLTTTDLTNSVNWSSKNGADPHGPDSVFAKANVQEIPNLLGQIHKITNPSNIADIGADRENVISGKGNGAGGVFVLGKATETDFFPNKFPVGSPGSVDVKSLMDHHMQNARSSGATAFNMIIHAKNDMVGSTAEYFFVAGQTIGGIHNADFYKTSAYIAFNSKESPTQSKNSTTLNSRRTIRHVYKFIPRSAIDGISMSNVVSGQGFFKLNDPTIAIDLRNKLAWDGTPKTLRVNQIADNNEAVVAQRDIGSPLSVECLNKTVTVTDITDDKIVFTIPSAVSTSFLFTNGAYRLSGAVYIADENFGAGLADRFFVPKTFAGFSLRFVGSGPQKYYIEGSFSSIDETRLFPSTQPSPSLGIKPGFLIRITSTNGDARDGIYRVLSIQDGMVGDDYYNTYAGGNPQYQYLEVEYISTSPQIFLTGTSIENVSNLPILSVKYRQTI